MVGTPRSGTTLVQRLACELPGVRMPPETHFFERFAGELLARARFPLAGAAIAAEVGRFLSLPTSHGLDVDAAAVVGRLGGTCDGPWDLFAALVACLAQPLPSPAEPARSAHPGDSPPVTLGEKTPGHVLWWRAATRAAPDLRLVCTVRDPRAVVASNLAAPWAGEAAGCWGEDAHLHFAQVWATHQQQVMAAARTLGPGCLVLRYEDVVTDPNGARQALGRLLALPAGPGHHAAEHPGAGPGHHTAEQPATVPDAPAPVAGISSGIVLPWESWKAAAVGPVDPARAWRWRSSLSDRQAAEVAAVCRRSMGAFGYPPPSAATAAATLLRLGPTRLRHLRGQRRSYATFQRRIDARRL